MISVTTYVVAQTIIEDDTIDITAVVQDPNQPPAGGGGGGGTNTTNAATVSMQGYTFPGAKLTLLKDGQVATTLVANPDGTFQITLNNLVFGTYQLSLFAEDQYGVTSSPYTVNVPASSTQPYVYANIILPPTFSANQVLVRLNDSLSVFGYAAPGATVTLKVPGSVTLGSAIADNTGFYRIEVRAQLAPGSYSLRVDASFAGGVSLLSKPVQVLIYDPLAPGAPDQPAPPSQYSSCVDYSNDRRVNLVDFSILLYWFGRERPPETVDCNGDRTVDIKDFSILMYFWTG